MPSLDRINNYVIYVTVSLFTSSILRFNENSNGLDVKGRNILRMLASSILYVDDKLKINTLSLGTLFQKTLDIINEPKIDRINMTIFYFSDVIIYIDVDCSPKKDFSSSEYFVFKVEMEYSQTSY